MPPSPSQVSGGPIRIAERLAGKKVLLTGATGFLGAFLLHELLTDEDTIVHCLVRADDAAFAKERLRENLVTYGLLTDAFDERVVPVVGDLSKHSLGLSPEAFAELADQVDGIYHSAAIVDFTFAALFPMTLLIGLFKRPAKGQFVEWFIRWGNFRARAWWCFLMVPTIELWGLLWWRYSLGYWQWAHPAHLFGLVCGVGVVLLLPARITIGRRAAGYA